MLHFEESYFEGEEREGFFVESKMKHAWAAQLEMLGLIGEICRKHDIKYFADFGTLLGAVRHKGFIPWDDDIDISMLRDDYEKFLRVAKEELPEGCRLLCIYTEDQYRQPFARVTNGNQIRWDKEYLEKWHGCPYVIGIDIFPRDYLSRNAEEEALRDSLLTMAIKAREAAAGSAPNLEKILQLVEEYCQVKLDRSKPLDHQLLVLIDHLSQMFLPEEADEVAVLFWHVEKNLTRCHKNCFEKQEWMPFEVTKIAVSRQAHECLRLIYGDDYMTPKRVQGGHGYPFYAEQDRMYQKAVAEN